MSGLHIEPTRTLTLPLSSWADIIEAMWEHENTKEYAIYMIDEMVYSTQDITICDLGGAGGASSPQVGITPRPD